MFHGNRPFGFNFFSDFGMSRIMNADINATNSQVGPLRWMSPELIRDRVYSTKSDVWSFACCIYVRIFFFSDCDNKFHSTIAGNICQKGSLFWKRRLGCRDRCCLSRSPIRNSKECTWPHSKGNFLQIFHILTSSFDRLWSSVWRKSHKKDHPLLILFNSSTRMECRLATENLILPSLPVRLHQDSKLSLQLNEPEIGVSIASKRICIISWFVDDQYIITIITVTVSKSSSSGTSSRMSTDCLASLWELWEQDQKFIYLCGRSGAHASTTRTYSKRGGWSTLHTLLPGSLRAPLQWLSPPPGQIINHEDGPAILAGLVGVLLGCWVLQ